MLTTALPELSLPAPENRLAEAEREVASRASEASTPNTAYNNHRLADINLTVPPIGRLDGFALGFPSYPRGHCEAIRFTTNPKFTPSTPTRTPSRDREQHFYAFEVVTA
jgi:hypothetical protein